MAVYGYVRVSTAAQVEDGELIEVANLALPQAPGGFSGGEVATGDGGQYLFQVVGRFRHPTLV